MSILINTLYAIVTWIAALTIGFSSWLGWALVVAAALQTWALLVTATRRSE